ncbi:MAG: toprim domain-containing protein [Balneolaceae bacterium]|nr:toprim domain-containing protein [Balneolaceae bacterium]
MNTSVYTLLIVESPTIAGIIQKICPPSVYVLSTDGFCWRPKYDSGTHQIKAIADPEKREIRKEIKEQSKIANTIVVAVDSDASGDFIAWSINRFIKSSNVKRAQLQGLSRTGIYSMLSNTAELDESHLETRLKNRFLIQHLWSKYSDTPDLQFAGLISVFGANKWFQTFLDQNDSVYESSAHVQCDFDEWISVRTEHSNNHYRSSKPLSTFDVLEYLIHQQKVPSGYDSQLLLNQLFQTILPFSEESLISYPRTSAQAFYSDTWTDLRKQYLKRGSVNDLKTTYLQEIADSESPHESIHPIDLSLAPDSVSGELPSNTGQLYRWIYDQTIKSLSMPKPVDQILVSDLNPDIVFFQDSEKSVTSAESLRPCVTLSDFGIQLHELGVMKPSGFGKTVDEWISKGWIELNGRIVTPGNQILGKLDQAHSLRKKLMELKRLKEEPTLKRETVVNIITS